MTRVFVKIISETPKKVKQNLDVKNEKFFINKKRLDI
jgi:hypothetical protein